jgi:hypothetical protein
MMGSNQPNSKQHLVSPIAVTVTSSTIEIYADHTVLATYYTHFTNSEVLTIRIYFNAVAYADYSMTGAEKYPNSDDSMKHLRRIGSRQQYPVLCIYTV